VAKNGYNYADLTRLANQGWVKGVSKVREVNCRDTKKQVEDGGPFTDRTVMERTKLAEDIANIEYRIGELYRDQTSDPTNAKQIGELSCHKAKCLNRIIEINKTEEGPEHRLNEDRLKKLLSL
jgi:hypothetical protein